MRKTSSFGASLSIKQCRNFGLEPTKVLRAAIKELDIRRFRLMSYWDEIEKTPGTYDFTELDKQVATVERANGTITMCLGVRQPRWPESHWPLWTDGLSKEQRDKALLEFIATVVKRYRYKHVIVSWQLENEALLKNFGERGDFDRDRLKTEFDVVYNIGGLKPVIMTTSTSWGIPLRRPIPDIVGFSFYRITHNKGAYRTSIYQPWIFKLRARLITIFWRRPSFIHELQAEPWGPQNIWDMSPDERAKSMNPKLLQANLSAAIKTKLYPIDLWGLEWWYWEKLHGNVDPWRTIKKTLTISYNRGHGQEKK